MLFSLYSGVQAVSDNGTVRGTIAAFFKYLPSWVHDIYRSVSFLRLSKKHRRVRSIATYSNCDCSAISFCTSACIRSANLAVGLNCQRDSAIGG